MSEIETITTAIEETSAEPQRIQSTAATSAPTAPPGLFTLAPLSPAFTSAALDALSMARTIGKRDPVNNSLLRIPVGRSKVEITSAEVSKLGVGEQKLLRYAVSMFTKVNAGNEKNPTLKVYGSTKDYARACGERIDPKTMDTAEAQEKENRRAAKALDNFKVKVRKNAEALRIAGFRWEENTKGKNKAYGAISFISGYRVDDNTITLTFAQDVAEILVQRPLSETPRALYSISERNPNAYAMAEAMAKHYGIYNNVMAGTEQVLKVETLLSYTGLGDAVGATGRYRSRWESRIKEPFEAALDELALKGFFRPVRDGESLHNWRYCTSGQVPLSDEEAESIVSYEQWLSLYVRFELADFAPHEERHREIADRKEAQKAKAEEKRKRRRDKVKSET